MTITPIAPLDYERYATLYGPAAVPVEGRLSVKPPQKSTEAVTPVSAEVSRRQTSSMQNKGEKFNLVSDENQGAARERIIVGEQKLTDISWIAEYASGLRDSGSGLNSPSPKKVAEIYRAQGDTPPQIFKRSG